MKAGHDFSERQSVELFVSHFDLEQKLRCVSQNGNRPRGISTTSVRDTFLGKPAENSVTRAALALTDRAPFGGKSHRQLLLSDFATTYGGTTSAKGTFVRDASTFEQSRIAVGDTAFTRSYRVFAIAFKSAEASLPKPIRNHVSLRFPRARTASLAINI